MESEHYKIDLYDLGGGKNIRKIWNRYYAEVHGCIFVVDAADTERMEARSSPSLRLTSDFEASARACELLRLSLLSRFA